MSSFLPTRPKPTALGSSYARDFDEAERASSGIGRAKIEAASNTSRPTAIYKRLSRSSISMLPRTEFPTPSPENLLAPASSAIKKLLQYSFFQRESSEAVLRPFKRNNVDNYPEGYPQLAAFMASDDNLSIYRKFERPCNRVLLDLQSQITALVNRLDELDRLDKSSSTTSYRLQSIKHEEGWDDEQRKLITELQERLSTYYDLLLKNSQLKALGLPLKHNHQSLFYWIEGKKPIVEDQDEFILHEDDLVALADIDHLESSLVSSFMNRPFRRSKHGDKRLEPVVHYFSQKRISAAAKSLSVFIAAAVLIVPVSILMWIPCDRAMISITVLLSVLIFSTLLSLSTNVKGKDILLGSAAYCAVLATFLGNLPSVGYQKTGSPV
ncbi:hypothetical protein L207DRAFT_471355 [Hyaloscypha variabilis F]|uniref:DUF6594 domain-containing protein n=1 Tax=Hyaloscypha variabilis (strain UAMH 11265 / GT02V1 / F) TaxID=1149755 RepID=A0A2J6R0H5_HYAVF|nr:hypothetical protein L207DRAFT_471355 [Hyaloscypha variabilis F]